MNFDSNSESKFQITPTLPHWDTAEEQRSRGEKGTGAEETMNCAQPPAHPLRITNSRLPSSSSRTSTDDLDSRQLSTRSWQEGGPNLQ